MTYTFTDDGHGGYVITPSNGDVKTIAQNEVSTHRDNDAGIVEITDGEHFFLAVGVANVSGATTLTDVWDAIQAARANDSDGGGGSTDISGLLRKDGSTPGATAQAQEMVNGVTSSIDVNNFSEIKNEYVHVKSTANDCELLISGQNGVISSANIAGGTFSQLEKDKVVTPLVNTLNVAHANALLTPADAVKINGVKCYRALLSQTGTSDPTAVVLENTLGETPGFSRNDTGIYSLVTGGNVFVAGKTFVTMDFAHAADAADPVLFIRHKVQAETEIKIVTNAIDFVGASTPAQDAILDNTEIQILVYP